MTRRPEHAHSPNNQPAGGSSPPNYMFRPVRTRLLEALSRPGEWPKVISIVAPIGYGKTVLMAGLHGHLRETGKQCLWVGLDDRHTTVERVLQALSEALAGPSVALEPTQALLRGDEPLARRIDALLDALTQLESPLTVLIDNLNSCVDERLGALLDALLFRTSARVRFVWSSTTELAFDVGRAKLDGRIRQVGFVDLSLDQEETRELLGPELSGRIGRSGIEAVRLRTEGWPAAVRMAQIVLSASDEPASALATFSGSDDDVAALLKHEVLSRFTPELRDFALCLSQLRVFGTALCRHAIGSDATQQHLEFLLTRNVFVIPLDRHRKRYRLHGLFREYLLAEAERLLDEARRAEVLRRASEWSAQEGDWHDAIEYALSAGAMDDASRLVERTASVFVRESGDIRQFVAWVERLRARGVRLGWDTQYWYVWALVFQHRYEHGLQQHRLLAERFERRAAHDIAPEGLSQRILHLRICIDLFTDRMDDAYRGAEAWLAANTANSPYGIGSIGCIKSLCLASSFKLPQAWQTMRAAQPVLLEIDGDDMRGWSSLIHATLLTYEGDYARARVELADGLAQACQRLGEGAVLCGTMAFVGASCAVEMGSQQDAHDLLALGMKTACNNTLLDTVACGFDAALKLWDGRADGLVASLREIARGYPPRLSLMLSCYLIRRLLRLGRLADAEEEGQRIGVLVERPETAGMDAAALAVARYQDLRAATAIDLLVATRRYKRASELIAREFPIAREQGRANRLVELGLAQAEIALKADDVAGAARALSTAVTRAARRAITRPFHDRIEVVAALVDLGKSSPASFALAEERTFYNAICEALPAEVAGTPAGCSLPEDATPGASMTPTAREAELLSLLDMGLSNQEIADRTEVSITTIKWHLKNLYRKFGVSTRTAALARARALSLLSRP